MRRVAETLTSDDVVLDLGAHIGNASTEFAQYAGHVYAFEPNPVVYAKLVRQTRKYRNITTYNKAIFDENTFVDLFTEDGKRGNFFEGSTVMEGKSNVTYKNRTLVEAVDICDFISTLDKRPTCIKMDIEGAEYRILERLIDSGEIFKIEKIYVECHVDRVPGLVADKERIIEKAESLGVMNRIDLNWH
jgi:FkbM family methyltransferase